MFNGFVKKSTQVIGNYHFAYEGLILEYTKEANITSFQDCFQGPVAGSALTPLDPLAVAADTRDSAEPTGKSLYRLFLNRMEDPDLDLPNEKGHIDYYAMVHGQTPELPAKDEAKELSDEDLKRIERQHVEMEELKNLREGACELMKKLTLRTWSEIDLALYKISTSSKTGK